MSGGYPFSTLIGNNVLDQILSPKIVGSAGSGYQVKLDLGNVDTVYADQVGTPLNRVSDLYGVTLHYQYLDPPITGGGGGSGTTGATGPTGPGGTGPAGPRGPTGATGPLVRVTVDEEIDSLPPGATGYVFNDSMDPSIVNLVFGLPVGATGPPGPGGGSGSQITQGPVGNVLFFGATGVTSSNSLNFANNTLTVPTEIITQSGNTGQIRLTTAGGVSYIQSGSSSNNNQGNILSVGRLNSGTDRSTMQLNTQSYQVAIGEANTPTGSPNNPTLDVYGRTLIHVDPGPNTSGGTTLGTPFNVLTSGFQNLITGNYYRIYGWGEGGTGPNATAGGEIEFDVDLTSSPTVPLNWDIVGSGAGGGSAGSRGGNALRLLLNGNPLWAYGGGGGSSILTGGAGGQAVGAVGGQGGSVQGAGGGTGAVFEFSAGGGTYTFNGDNPGSTFTTALTTPGYYTFPAGTTFTFPRIIPLQNQFVNIPTAANDTIRIDLPSGGFSSLVGTATISGIPVVGAGNQYFATTAINNVPLGIPAGATIVSTPIVGNGQGATAGPNINVTGSQIQILSRGTPQLSTSSAQLRGDSSVFYATAGSITFGTTGAIEYDGTTIVLTESMRVDFVQGRLTADTITAVLSQTIAIGFPNYGSISTAGSGTAGQGGAGINGGGGGGGFYGGGGGNENIGGVGSSLVTTTGATNGKNNSIIPSTSPYNDGVYNAGLTYGAPRRAGGWVIIELRIRNALALGVTGNVVVDGSVTINGTGNSLSLPNGSLVAAGVQSTVGYTNVSGNLGVAAVFPLGLTVNGSPNAFPPVGCIVMYGAASPPVGWLVCNGSAVPGIYTALISLIGPTLPDLRSRVPIGFGQGTGLINYPTMFGSGGNENSTLPSHTHTINDPGHNHSNLNQGGGFAAASGGNGNRADSTGARTSTELTGISINASGTSPVGTNLPPFLVVNYIIKY
jgi:microcystin-dependent protein